MVKSSTFRKIYSDVALAGKKFGRLFKLRKLEACLLTIVTVTVCTLHTFTDFSFFVAILYDLIHSLGSSRAHSDSCLYSFQDPSILFTAYFFQTIIDTKRQRSQLKKEILSFSSLHKGK